MCSDRVVSLPNLPQAREIVSFRSQGAKVRMLQPAETVVAGDLCCLAVDAGYMAEVRPVAVVGNTAGACTALAYYRKV